MSSESCGAVAMRIPIDRDRVAVRGIGSRRVVNSTIRRPVALCADLHRKRQHVGSHAPPNYTEYTYVLKHRRKG